MEYDFSNMSNAELEAYVYGNQPLTPQTTSPSLQGESQSAPISFDDWSNEELEAYLNYGVTPQRRATVAQAEATPSTQTPDPDYGFNARQRDRITAESGREAYAGQAYIEGLTPATRAVRQGVEREEDVNRGAFLDRSALDDAISRYGDAPDESLMGYKAEQQGLVADFVGGLGQRTADTLANLPFFIGDAVKGVRGLARRAYDNRATDVLIDYARDSNFTDDEIERAKEFSQGDPYKMYDFFHDIAESAFKLADRERKESAQRQEANSENEGILSKIGSGALASIPMVEEFMLAGGAGNALGLGAKGASAFTLGAMGAEESRRRVGELAQDKYSVDENGNLQVEKGYDLPRAIAQGTAGGYANVALEMFAGKMLGGILKGVGKVGSKALPDGVSNWASSVASGAAQKLSSLSQGAKAALQKTAAGRVLANLSDGVARLERLTRIGGMPEEMLEENMQTLFDDVIGLNLRPEDRRNVYERFQDAFGGSVGEAVDKQVDTLLGLVGVMAVLGVAGYSGANRESARRAWEDAEITTADFLRQNGFNDEIVGNLNEKQREFVADLVATSTDNKDLLERAARADQWVRDVIGKVSGQSVAPAAETNAPIDVDSTVVPTEAEATEDDSVGDDSYNQQMLKRELKRNFRGRELEQEEYDRQMEQRELARAQNQSPDLTTPTQETSTSTPQETTQEETTQEPVTNETRTDETQSVQTETTPIEPTSGEESSEVDDAEAEGETSEDVVLDADTDIDADLPPVEESEPLPSVAEEDVPATKEVAKEVLSSSTNNKNKNKNKNKSKSKNKGKPLVRADGTNPLETNVTPTATTTETTTTTTAEPTPVVSSATTTPTATPTRTPTATTTTVESTQSNENAPTSTTPVADTTTTTQTTDTPITPVEAPEGTPTDGKNKKGKKKNKNAKKTELQKLEDSIKRNANKAKKVFLRITKDNPTAEINPNSFRYSENNPSGLHLKELEQLDYFAEDDWHKELGLSDADAEKVLQAVKTAYEQQRLASSNRKDKANDAGETTYAVSASKTLEKLALYPDNPRYIASAHQKVSAAYEAAKRNNNTEDAKLWEKKLIELNELISNASPSERQRIFDSMQAASAKRVDADEKHFVSIVNPEGETTDFADPNAADPSNGYTSNGDGVDINNVADTHKPTTTKAGEEIPNRIYRLVRKSGQETVVQYNNNGDVVKRVPFSAFSKMVKASPLGKEWIKDLKEGKDISFSIEPTAELPKQWDPKIRKELTDVADRAKGWINGVTIKFADMPFETADESAKMRDKNGGVVGSFNRTNKELILYPGATADTVAHELGWHATYLYAEEEAEAGRPELLERLKWYARTAPESIKRIVRADYGDVSLEALVDEMGAHRFEKEGGAQLTKAIKTLEGKAWYNRFMDFVKGVWDGMLRRMGVEVNRVDLLKAARMNPDEAVSWLGEQMAKGKNLGELGETSRDEVRRSIVGRRGAENLGIGKLSDAERMESEGADRERIWRETGWWRGGDGEWRIEVNDIPRNGLFDGDVEKDSRWEPKGNKDFAYYETSLEKLFGASHPIFSAYPDLKEYRVKITDFGEDARVVGGYVRDNGVIVINSRFFNLMSAGGKRSALAHEVQHAIQEIEGFFKDSHSSIGGDDYESYWKSGDEVEARNVEHRLEMTPEERAATPPWETEDVPEEEQIARKSDEMLYRHFRNDKKVSDEDYKKILKQLAKDGWEIYDKNIAKQNSELPLSRIWDVSDRRRITEDDIEDLASRRQIDIYPPYSEVALPVTLERNQDARQMVRWLADALGTADATKVESATTFLKRAGVTIDDMRYARRPASSLPPQSFMDEKQTVGNTLNEKFVDSTAPLQHAQRKIEEKVGKGSVKEITNADGSTDWRNSTDLVAAKDKANGHLERRIRDLHTKFIEPTMEILGGVSARSGKTTEKVITDFNTYLQCMHAAERNHSVATDRGDPYTPKYAEGMGKIDYFGTGPVGLSEEVATDILNDLNTKYGREFANFDKAAKNVYAMLRADLDGRRQSGLLTKSEYDYYMDRWNGRDPNHDWKHYVPLKDDLKRFESDAYNAFSTSIRRNEFMKAKGRGDNDIAKSPLAASFLQAEQGIRRGIRNELANVEANLAALYNGGFSSSRLDSEGVPLYAEIVPGVDKKRVGADYEFQFGQKGDAVSATGNSHVVNNRPDIHLFKRDGQLYAIKYRIGNEGLGLSVAKSASGENMGGWSEGMQWVPKLTRLFSAMRTQYSPEFTISNMLADHLEALQALVGRYGVWDGGKAFLKTVGSEIANAKDLWHYARTGEARGNVKAAVDAGLLTKGGVASQGFDAEHVKMRNNIEKYRRMNESWAKMLTSPTDMAKSFTRNVFDFISMANEFAEYSTRIGIATALVKENVPLAQAIKFARDATVNFNRKGTAMPYINGLYMFANAAVQGSMRSLQAFRDDLTKSSGGSELGGRKIRGTLISTLVLVGVAKALIDHFIGDDDEREKAGERNAKYQSEYDRKHNVGVPIGGGYQFVPLRFRGPYAAIPYLAQTYARLALGDVDPSQAALLTVSELGTQVTDLVGGSGILDDRGEYDGSLVMQSLSPTFTDPLIQLATGKDYKGDERRKKSFDATLPASSNGRRNTPQAYKSIAQWLNSISGGNENRIGKIDFAPEDIQLITEFIGGGPMRDMGNALTTIQNLMGMANGEEPDNLLANTPVVRRLVREYPENTRRFYEAVEMYDREKAEYRKATRLEDRKRLREGKPYLSANKTRLDSLIQQVKDLSHLEHGEVRRGQKWVMPKIERSVEQREAYRKRRLNLQAKVLGMLGY